MAMKKSTPSGNPGGKTSQKISPSVTVLGKYNTSGSSRKALTGTQLADARALADKIKAKEVKAANEKKANAKIIKKQNKQKPLRPSGPTKPISSDIFKKPKPIIKVKPRGGGMRGGSGGGLFGTKNR